jgi:hypothetical protein
MKRRRYQYGCLTRKHHSVSEDVWQFRFYETLPDGRRARRARVVGTVRFIRKPFPNKRDLQTAQLPTCSSGGALFFPGDQQALTATALVIIQSDSSDWYCGA